MVPTIAAHEDEADAQSLDQTITAHEDETDTQSLGQQKKKKKRKNIRPARMVVKTRSMVATEASAALEGDSTFDDYPDYEEDEKLQEAVDNFDLQGVEPEDVDIIILAILKEKELTQQPVKKIHVLAKSLLNRDVQPVEKTLYDGYQLLSQARIPWGEVKNALWLAAYLYAIHLKDMDPHQAIHRERWFLTNEVQWLCTTVLDNNEQWKREFYRAIRNRFFKMINDMKASDILMRHVLT